MYVCVIVKYIACAHIITLCFVCFGFGGFYFDFFIDCLPQLSKSLLFHIIRAINMICRRSALRNKCTHTQTCINTYTDIHMYIYLHICIKFVAIGWSIWLSVNNYESFNVIGGPQQQR